PAAKSRQALLQRGVAYFCFLDVLDDREHDIRSAGGKGLAGVGAAGLQHHRVTLRAAADIERPLYLEERAVMVDRAKFCRIDVETAPPVGDDGIIRPAVPQPPDDVEEFAGHFVAA